MSYQGVIFGGEADEKIRAKFKDSSISSSVSSNGIAPSGLNALSNGKLLLVNIDVNKFNQVLHDLLSNAMKFTPEGGSVCICPVFFSSDETLFSTYQNGVVHIHIIDTGCGIQKVIRSCLVIDVKTHQHVMHRENNQYYSRMKCSLIHRSCKTGTGRALAYGLQVG